MLTIELGTPIKPQCADPVAILIFLSFIAMVFGSAYFQQG